VFDVLREPLIERMSSMKGESSKDIQSAGIRDRERCSLECAMDLCGNG